jgi:glycosyltransferase involved in cell wall biosynthesis
MVETLVVRIFGIDVSDPKVYNDLPWKIGRLFPWIFTDNVPVCFLGVGRGWKGWKENGPFSSHASLKAIPSDAPLPVHINKALAWVTNFIDVVWFAHKSKGKVLVVMAHTPPFGLGAALAKILLADRIRLVVRILGNEPGVSLLVRRSVWRFKLEQKIEKFVLTKADLVLPMGKFTYDLSIAYGVDPRKIVVLPFPVTWPNRPQATDLPRRPTVLFCGRVIKAKGLHILLQAMQLVKQQVSDAQLVIVGEASNRHYRQELEQMAESLGICDSVSFLGWVRNDSIGKIYQESWVLAVPSIWEEGLGMVMVEAGLTGRTVIGSDLGGIKDFIQHGANGLLVRPGDVKELADAISSILQDRSRAIEMGRQNSVMARRYLDDFDGAVPQVRQAIHKLVDI